MFTGGVGPCRATPAASASREIEKNDFNLNLPRYIDTRAAEDRQDIEAHLNGGIPEDDIAALQDYWQVCPQLGTHLFRPLRAGYLQLAGDTSIAGLNTTIKEHADVRTFRANLEKHFTHWRAKTADELKLLDTGLNPKAIIDAYSEDLLAHYKGQPLIDPYAVYQHLMDYVAETLQDDLYLIALEGWTARPEPILETVKSGKQKGRQVEKGWTCDLVPKPLVVARYFADEQATIEAQQAELDATAAERTQLEEEQSGEDGALSDFDKINKASVAARLKELKADPGNADLRIGPCRDATNQEIGAPGLQAAEDPAAYNQAKISEPITGELSEADVLQRWLDLHKAETTLKKAIKTAEARLDQLAREKYPELSEDEIKTLVVDDKWLATLEARIHGELDRIEQVLTQRVAELADRYETPLPQVTSRVSELDNQG